MDADLRLNICRLVAGIVVTDEDLDPREDAFIDRMLVSFGIPISERNTIFPIVDGSEAAAAMAALPEGPKQEALKLLLDAACVDGKVVEEERVYLHSVGSAIGIPAGEMDRRITARLTAD
ncbi:MAG: hypothetical protein EXR72_11275 [Myxococcales bacterium]|nr:hypothetical protein [Myxococcales bacterium]